MTAKLTSAQITALYSAGDFEMSGAYVAPFDYNTRRDSPFCAATAEADTKLVLETAGTLNLYARGLLIATSPLISGNPEAALYQNHLKGDWMEYRAWYKPVAAGARGYGMRWACNGCFGRDQVGTPSGGALSTATAVQARSWVSGSTPTHVSPGSVLNGSLAADQIGRGVILGDSIMAVFNSTHAVGSRIYTRAEAQRAGYGILSLATPSDTSSDQLAVWQASNSRGAAGVAWVAIQVGYNDIQTLTAAQAITNIQALVNDVAAQNPNAKIVICKMTPALATSAPSVYTKLLTVNDAIAGTGGTPITGVHARVTSHFDLMKDGNGDLASAYTGIAGETYPDGVHPNNAGRVVNAEAIRTALQSLSVL